MSFVNNVIIGIFCISIKIRNFFVVFVESMKKHKKDRVPAIRQIVSNDFKRLYGALQCRITCYDFKFLLRFKLIVKSLFFSCRSRRMLFLQFV